MKAYPVDRFCRLCRRTVQAVLAGLNELTG